MMIVFLILKLLSIGLDNCNEFNIDLAHKIFPNIKLVIIKNRICAK